ncbi:cupin domain-containing protein [Roseobacter sp.]|uniref:cupin domain-containing protein n=1 Tax=Roseobacter sp. TaxID=1907202 RepID=UPI00385EE6AA
MTGTLETQPDRITAAEVYLSVEDLKTEMPFFIKQLGFRLEEIFPADDPAVALVSGHGMRIRLDRNMVPHHGKIRLRCTDPDYFAGGLLMLTSPSGHTVEIVDANPPLDMPETQHSFMVRHLRDSDSWIIGRAGMHYRDLIPDRLGGSIIASHIRIPDGGPVPDMVHYHTVGFQLIFCYRGWVRLVYEDQGDPFVLEAGCCVIQPPEIRHRVLEASDNVEVLEIGVPAEHITTIDHKMSLPNGRIDSARDWQGTRFVHHRVQDAIWSPWRIPGWESRDTGIGKATAGVAGVHVARPTESGDIWTSHDTDILFTFVKEGTMTLEVSGEKPVSLVAGDAFVLPPFLKTRYVKPSTDCELIETALQADFQTDFT